MHEGDRTQRRLADGRAIELPPDATIQRQRVGNAQLAEDVVWMLLIHDGLAVIGLARLEELGKSAVRRGSDSAESIWRKSSVPRPSLRCSITISQFIDS